MREAFGWVVFVLLAAVVAFLVILLWIVSESRVVALAFTLLILGWICLPHLWQRR